VLVEVLLPQNAASPLLGVVPRIADARAITAERYPVALASDMQEAAPAFPSGDQRSIFGVRAELQAALPHGLADPLPSALPTTEVRECRLKCVLQRVRRRGGLDGFHMLFQHHGRAALSRDCL